MADSASLFYAAQQQQQQQQGVPLLLQPGLGAQPPLPAPSVAKQFLAANLGQSLAQRQQQLSQTAQWSALQGVLRGLTGKPSSAEGLANLSAALASSQAAQLGKLGWQAAQQNRGAACYQVGITAVGH